MRRVKSLSVKRGDISLHISIRLDTKNFALTTWEADATIAEVTDRIMRGLPDTSRMRPALHTIKVK